MAIKFVTLRYTSGCDILDLLVLEVNTVHKIVFSAL